MKHLKGILIVTLLILVQGLLFSTPRLVSNSKIPLRSDRATISANTLEGTVTPADLVQTILGGGIVPSNIVYTGANRAAATFTGGLDAGLGIPSGIILCSGAAELAIGPNNSTQDSYDNSTAGDPDLTALIGGTTNDLLCWNLTLFPRPQMSSLPLSWVLKNTRNLLHRLMMSSLSS